MPGDTPQANRLHQGLFGQDDQLGIQQEQFSDPQDLGFPKICVSSHGIFLRIYQLCVRGGPRQVKIIRPNYDST